MQYASLTLIIGGHKFAVGVLSSVVVVSDAFTVAYNIKCRFVIR